MVWLTNTHQWFSTQVSNNARDIFDCQNWEVGEYLLLASHGSEEARHATD